MLELSITSRQQYQIAVETRNWSEC